MGRRARYEFSPGRIRDSIIIDNDRNIFSDFPLKLAPNFIGALPHYGKQQYAPDSLKTI